MKFAALFLCHSYVNVMIVGIQRTTHDLLLAGFHILGIMPGVNFVSSCKRFLDVDSLCVLLSFSTKGSTSYPYVDKVRDALAIVKKRNFDLKIDAELQLDAAIVSEDAKKRFHKILSWDGSIFSYF